MENIDEINKLKEELEIREKSIEQLKARIKPFEDSYFNGLSPIEIAELAKKSIRLTCENRKLEDLLQEIKAIAENAYCLTNYTNKDMANLAKQILLKITKAEEE